MPKRSKYKAVPTIVDGKKFASKAEARRYSQLRLLEKAGEIINLETHPVFPLYAMCGQSKHPVQIGKYIADFKYKLKATGREIVEDVKGVATSVFRLKKKIVEANHGVEIKEVRA